MRKFLAILMVLTVTTPMAVAHEIRFTEDWKTLEFRSIPATEYTMNGSTVEITAEKSSSVIYSPIHRLDWQAFNATWSWEAISSVPPTNLSEKGADDRNIALYFVFLDQKTANKIGEIASIRKLLTSRKSRILVYTFGGDKPDGTFEPNPYLGKRGAIIIKRGAVVGAFDEVVDLAADYRRAFGQAPDALVGIALASDSDNSDMTITARVENLVLN
ncbi:MAG: DUF3047 domain-containing protein [Alphaproteobacteria bacterium]|nr:DUF3047 domain-containing protein [Alphaproteobacteria bacterium]